MLDFYYLSPSGSVVDFRSKNVFSDPAWMRKYKWDIDTNNGTFTSVGRKEQTWTLDAWFLGNTATECAHVRNEAYKTFDYDVAHKTPGRLYVGGSYLICFVSGISNPDANPSLTKVNSELTIIAANPVWIVERMISFVHGGTSMVGGFDYTFDFPFDYASAISNIVSNDGVSDADFELRIYGPTQDPHVMINGHLYKAFGDVGASEMLVINSEQKTVELVAQDRTSVNWFSHRNREESVFETIPVGNNFAEWDDDVRWDIVLFEQSSEPAFEEA